MRSSHSLDRLDTAFDDDRLVADAGLLLPATLAQHLDLKGLVDEHLDLGDKPGRAHVGDKLLSLVLSALAGGDCIDDANALRAGGTERVLGFTVKAASTLGTFLRSFRWGHVRQLDRVSRELLERAWAAGAGPGARPLTIDLDSTICETYGLHKAGGSFTYSHVRGYHPLLAVAAGSGDVLHARLRGGPANTGRGAAGFLAETVGRVRAAGAGGQLTMRADSGFYRHDVVAACRRADVRFSITVRQQAGVRRLIEAIPDAAWTPIAYPLEGGADVAELPWVPFDRRAGATAVRLIVRRVRPKPDSQLALFTDHAYHPFITDRPGDMLELEADHRRHAEVELVIKDLKQGPWAHMPSGRFGANAAWLALGAIAHNLAGWSAKLGKITEGTGPIALATLRRRYIAVPGHLSRSARRTTLHLVKNWPWAKGFLAALSVLRELTPILT
ncbi:MAG: IS1380 family transposase [Candidatus Limnocylindrales bacterium]